MNFYIHHIRLWFKANQVPVTYDFLPNKVNVITGDSSTGKSSLLRIIDYCLLSPSPAIVEEVINENVSWYGLCFHLNGRDYIIARRAPGSDMSSLEVYFSEGVDLPEQPVGNISRAKLEQQLNKEFGIDNIVLRQGKDTLRVSYRYFLLFCYLTEDIIATMNSYFDTDFFNDRLYDLFLDPLLKLAIGLDELNETDLKQALQGYEKKMKSLARSYKIRTTKNKNYDKNLYSILNLLRDLGFVKFNEMSQIQKNEILSLAYRFMNQYESLYFKLQTKSELNDLRHKEREIKKQQAVLARLEKEFNDYNQYLTDTADSLTPIKYINEHLDDVLLLDETKDLLKNLTDSLLNIKASKKDKPIMPADFAKRKAQLEEELERTKKQIEEVSFTEKNLTDYSWLTTFVELKHLLKQVGFAHDISNYDVEFKNLQEKIDKLKENLQNQKELNAQRTNSLNEFINIYYQMPHGVSDAYNSCVPFYDEHNRALMLRRAEDNSPVRNVGSKSNYMYLHLCFFLGLHEAILDCKSPYVPNFLFIDQPSIPYYESKDNGDKSHLDDKSKLKNAFNLINRAMERITKFSQKHPFQIIMVEHADEDYWNQLDFFETRYVFTKERDSGLIPRNIYNRV